LLILSEVQANASDAVLQANEAGIMIMAEIFQNPQTTVNNHNEISKTMDQINCQHQSQASCAEQIASSLKR
jgi:hypothetical protein